ncbi:ADP-ribose glycohydrolase MACROD2 isoform X3 [Megalobrama amblycephala]|uniref:ADP-ribose glycohydrolase MACROD2 isoform X3 n=1 Tax=Megalobrama amblycephala TaxID=75352 RepID=UPI002014617F|nr:ADP-ribose glycohydrolase MACROD2 isoform X3 [Megalobrama amblycephala]
MSKKKKEWSAEKERLLSLGLEDRRKDYRGNYVPLDKIPTWANPDNNTATDKEEHQSSSLADKVSLYRGDITILEVDAIVNAANSSLLGGGGVDGCIHRAAGHLLFEECHSLNGCDTGKAKITCGYDLPAKYAQHEARDAFCFIADVIHTVGPIARGNVGQSQKDDLASCYNNSLQLMKDNNLRSVAFPCISTGIYGFPNEPAAEIALKTVHDWIEANQKKIDRVIFCVFLETDYEIYKRKMSDFFSPDNDDHKKEEDARMEQGNTQPMEGEEDDDDGADKKGNTQSMEGEEDDDDGTDKKGNTQPMEGGEDDDDGTDKKGNTQPMEGEEDDDNGADKKADSRDDETVVQEDKTSAKEDHKVEVSPTAKKKPEPEREKEKEKKEDKGYDSQVAGDKKEDSPGKKMQTGQTDEAGKQMKDSTKSADIGADTSPEPAVPMEVQDAVTTAKESNTSSTKVDVQDKSSQEPDSTPPDSRPNSDDGQGNASAQE